MKKIFQEVLTKKKNFQPSDFDQISSQQTQRSGHVFQATEGAIRFDKPVDHRTLTHNKNQRQKFKLNIKKVIILIAVTFFLFFASKTFFSKIKSKPQQKALIVDQKVAQQNKNQNNTIIKKQGIEKQDKDQKQNQNEETDDKKQKEQSPEQQKEDNKQQKKNQQNLQNKEQNQGQNQKINQQINQEQYEKLRNNQNQGSKQQDQQDQQEQQEQQQIKVQKQREQIKRQKQYNNQQTKLSPYDKNQENKDKYKYRQKQSYNQNMRQKQSGLNKQDQFPTQQDTSQYKNPDTQNNFRQKITYQDPNKNNLRTSDIEVRNVYNKENTGKILGKSSRYYITLQSLRTDENSLLQQTIEKVGMDKMIQVGSEIDYGLYKLVNFSQLELSLSNDIAYETLQFNKQYNTQTPQLLQYWQLASEKSIKRYLKQLTHTNIQSFPNEQEYNLAVQLIRNPSSQKALQAQYYLADYKYQIGQKTTQIPMCIFTLAPNITKKSQYSRYLQSIDSLNYTNYKIIYIDDYSTDGSAFKVYDYVRNNRPNLKNKIKIVHNLQKLGALANMFFYTKRFCGQDDIVVMVDGDDTLVGRQVLKILSAVYENPNIWYAYSSYIIRQPSSEFIKKGDQASYLKFKTSEYRTSFQWQTSHLRTFRRRLVDSLPISTVIQYHVNRSKGRVWPVFCLFAPDLFFTFPLLEMCGNYRIMHLDQYFYNYNMIQKSSKECNQKHQIYDNYKSGIKTPLQQLRQLGQKGRETEDYDINRVDLQKIKKAYENLLSCQQQLSNKVL